MKEQISNSQDNDLWIKKPNNIVKIGQRQELNDYKLIQEEYLRNMEKVEQTEKLYLLDNAEKEDTCQTRDYDKIQRETKTNKMT